MRGERQDGPAPVRLRACPLLPSRFHDQVEQAREVYGALPNDDILKGFRREAGLPAPGDGMNGWCKRRAP